MDVKRTEFQEDETNCKTYERPVSYKVILMTGTRKYQ